MSANAHRKSVLIFVRFTFCLRSEVEAEEKAEDEDAAKEREKICTDHHHKF